MTALPAFTIHDINSQRIKLEKEKYNLVSKMMNKKCTGDDQERLRQLNIQLVQYELVANAMGKERK